ncbi:M48 family metallopeptidase [Lysinibacillus sp. KU-BSD001]|uniref:M48 family metallopeptidase n=1 Tax=Lysinibacillus sp. KU-BSD001 TaxID=3141328 RepID=UPI0036E2D646
MTFSEKDLVTSKEKIYFAILCIVSALVYIVAAISIIGIIVILFLFLFYWFIHNLAIVNIRKNGVKLNEQQFPHFYEQAKDIAQRMNLTQVPDIYVMQSGGILNAFATKFGLKNMVVLYADVFSLIDEQGQEEVHFILAHEFAHIKRKHVGLGWLLMPGLLVPFLSNAYSRACEFTCDRYGAYYSQSHEAAKNALVMLAIGPQLYKQVDQVTFMKQIETESGMFSWIDEILSTHPNLPKRVHAISGFFQADQTPVIKPSYKGVILGIVGLIVLTILFFIAIWWTLNTVSQLEDELLLGNHLPLEDGSMSGDYSYTYDKASMSDLMLAVVDWDFNAVQQYAKDDQALNDVSDEGYTALHLAVMESNHEIASYLLEQGTDPNTMDIYGFTPLIEAASYGDSEMVELLLTHGADKTMKDSSGYDAYQYAMDYGYFDIAQYIENY